MRFSANLSMLFTEKPLIERFKAAKDSGFEAVEIQFPYELSAETIFEQLEKYKLPLVLFNVDADDLLQGGEGLAAVPEKMHQFEDVVNQAAQYAKLLKPEFINVLPGCCFDHSRIETYRKTLIENLKTAIRHFSRIGISTVFEAINTYDMPGFLIHSSRQMLQLMSDIDHPKLLMQYDIYHMSKMNEDIHGFINKHAREIGHIQFADNPGRGQPGSGKLNFADIFRTINQSDYQGWVGAEYKPIGITQSSLAWMG